MPLLTAALICFLTLADFSPDEIEMPRFEGADKVVHFIMFGFMAWILIVDSRVRRQACGGSLTGQALCAVAASTLFGIAIEFAQDQLTSTRGYDPADMAADFLGALAAWPVAAAVLRWLRR